MFAKAAALRININTDGSPVDKKLLCMLCMEAHAIVYSSTRFNSCVSSIRASTGLYLKAREKMFYRLRLVLTVAHILPRTTNRRRSPSGPTNLVEQVPLSRGRSSRSPSLGDLAGPPL